MSDIIVQFKPKGHKELIAAIQKLNLAQGGLVKNTNKLGKATGRNRKQMSFMQNGSVGIFSPPKRLPKICDY